MTGFINNLKANAPDTVGITGNVQRDMPWWYDAWETAPTGIQAMGWTSFRGARTIVGGGWSRAAFPASNLFRSTREGAGLLERMGTLAAGPTRQGMTDLMHRQALRLNPRSMMSYSHMERLNPLDNRHGVFQIANIVNWPMRQYAKSGFGSGSRLAGMAEPLSEGKIFAGGLWSTQSAATKLAHMHAISPSTAANVGKFISISDPATAGRIAGTAGPAYGASAEMVGAGLRGTTPQELSQTLRMSGATGLNRALGGYLAGVESPITNFAAAAAGGQGLRGAEIGAQALARGGFLPGETMGFRGFIGGMRGSVADNLTKAVSSFGAASFEGSGTEVVAKALTRQTEQAGMAFASDIATRQVAGVALREGAEKATLGVVERVAEKGAISLGEKLGARFAMGAAVSEIPFVGQAVDIGLAAWSIYDIGKALAGVGKAAAKSAAHNLDEASKSYQGGINKAPFSGYRGMGYIDNEAAATSRKRGVQAISNSRLNARSVLGSEAAMLHAHFG